MKKDITYHCLQFQVKEGWEFRSTSQIRCSGFTW